jgi:hypothetical protein
MICVSTVTIHLPQALTKPIATQPGSGAGIEIGTPAPEAGGDGTKTQLPIPPTVTAATEILQKFENAATPAKKVVRDSIAGGALQDSTSLPSETWVGTEDEKKDW